MKKFDHMKKYAKKLTAFLLIACMMVSMGVYNSNSLVKAVAADKASDSKGKSSLTLTFSKKSGAYKSGFSLKITCSGSKAIYYTTDGSDPITSKTGKTYSAAIKITDRKKDKNYVSAVDPTLFDSANVRLNKSRNGFVSTLSVPSDAAVDKCTVVRAVAQDSDGLYTDVVTNTYFVGSMADHIQGLTESCEAAGTSLAVMSISVNYEDLFDSKTGIYVKGNIYDKEVKDYIKAGNVLRASDARNFEANYTQTGKDWERSAHIDYIETDGDVTSLELQQDCGIRIQGNYSRSDLQKSFRLVADEDYGKKNFSYAFFGEDLKNDSGETIDKFKTVVLRNGGNCAFTTKYSDTYWQSLMENLDCETQSSRPCIVYLNGEYWGLYLLQEDYSSDYFEDTHGVNEDDVVLYKGDAEELELGFELDLGKLPEGVTDETYYLQDLATFASTHKDLSKDADFTEFAKYVDTESFRDYFAAEVWINNKWDWPGKNWSMWKTTKVDPSNPYADGRWRLCFYDVEFGGVSGASDAKTNTIKDDNYMPDGLLDLNTQQKPEVSIFAYLMTNKSFREDYEKKLLSLSNTNFKYSTASKVLDKFKNTYSPLYDQFFTRYSGTGYDANNANNGGYASYKCINDFLKQRANYIQPMIDWIEKYYSSK